MGEIIIPEEANNPQAYRDALLAVVGERNPIEILSTTHAHIVTLTERVSLETLHAALVPGEWSAQEQVQHLLDAEIAYAFRWRLMLTEDRPAYPSYTVKTWVDLPKAPFSAILEAFGVLRRLNLFLLQALPDSWQRVGIHAEQGPETIEVSLRKLAGHDLAHLNQLERTLEAVKAQR